MSVRFQDVFTATDGTTLDARVPNIGTSWDKHASQAANSITIVGNKAELAVTTKTYYKANASGGSSVGQFVRANMRLESASQNEQVALMARFAENTYPNVSAFGVAIAQTTGGLHELRLIYWNNQDVLAPTTIGAGVDIAAEYDGTAQAVVAIISESNHHAVFFNGVKRIDAIDTSVSSPGAFAGIMGKAQATSRAQTWDAFNWQDIDFVHLSSDLTDEDSEILEQFRLRRTRRRVAWR